VAKILCVIPITAVIASMFVLPCAEKMTSQELIAKHLEAIGTPAARMAVKNRLINGTAEVDFHIGAWGKRAGKSMVVSEGKKYRLGISFPMVDYTGEQVAFDGKTVTLEEIRPGVRSNLTAFLYDTGFIFSEGLLGGVTSTNWLFLDLDGRKPKPKIEYRGLKKIDGRSLYQLTYEGEKSGVHFLVHFYFDPSTYQHVLSVHEYTRPWSFSSGGGSGGGGGRTSGGGGVGTEQSGGIVNIVEEFGSFKGIDGLMLPRYYRLELSYYGQGFTAEWIMNFAEILHNQQLNPSLFNLQ